MGGTLSNAVGFTDTCIFRLGILTQFAIQLYGKEASSKDTLECAWYIGEKMSYLIGLIEKWIVGIVVGTGMLLIVLVSTAFGLGAFVLVLILIFRCSCPKMFWWVTEEKKRVPEKKKQT